MTPSQQILADLLAGPSTADSIAGRIEMETDNVTVSLMGMRVDKLVSSAPIMVASVRDEFAKPKSSGILVWKLTEEGQAIAETYPKEPQFP